MYERERKPGTSSEATSENEGVPGKRTRAGQIQRKADGAARAEPGAAWGQATAGAAQAVPYREQMEAAFNFDFGGVKAHLGGEGTRAGLDALGAEAAAQGDTIAFDSASPAPGLVAHELTHVVQQRQSGVAATQYSSTVSEPGDAAEREADDVAARVVAGERVTVGAAASGGIHRHIKGSDKVPLGEFAIDMTKVENPGGKSGEDGTVTFTPNAKAPDSTSIRLSQIVKTSSVTDGKDFDWSGGSEADRNKIQTKGSDKTHVTAAGDTLKKIAMRYYGDPTRTKEIHDANTAVLKSDVPDDKIDAGVSVKVPNAIEGGFFIDHMAADPRAAPRTKKTDAEVPQDYVWAGEESAKNKHGKKSGTTIEPAMLKDFPGHTAPLRYDFETVARSEDAGIYYGTIHWDFEINADKVSKESWKVTPGVSETFRSGLDEFNKFYKNKYTVMKGDTLWSIAAKYLGDPNRWPEIHEANKDLVKDPDHIEPGWKLNIPGQSAGT